MKNVIFGTIAILCISGTLLGDSVASQVGTTFTNFPIIMGSGLTAVITGSGSAGVQGTPYWNNVTSDIGLTPTGPKGNVGYFLSDTGDFSYAGGPLLSGGVYRSDSTFPNNAPSSFTFVQGAPTVGVTLLFTAAGNNFGANGTTVFLYNTDNVACPVKTAAGCFTNIYTSGQLWQGSGGNGLFNNGSLSTSSFSNSVGGTTTVDQTISTFAGWGLASRTCIDSINGTGCQTFYSNAGLNTAADPTFGVRNHFTLFAPSATASTYYVSFEDTFGPQATEAGGDYNDWILRISSNAAGTSPVPEPASLGTSLLAVSAVFILRRRAAKPGIPL